MRFFEFANTNSGLDKFILILKTEISNYSKRRSRGILNWPTVSKLAKRAGFEFLSDPYTSFETFTELYDSTPMLQELVTDFNQNSITLNVPGEPGEEEPTDSEDSQANVDKIAAGAAPGML